MERTVIKFFILSIILSACGRQAKVDRLPILGRHDIEEKSIGNEVTYDTLYHTIEPFEFVDQDSSIITNSTFEDKIYVADFFFTSCPSICPIMKTQMLRVYDAYQDRPDVAFLSHTIDPVHDSVSVLKEYAERLEVKSKIWHFVTGDKATIYELAQRSYMSVAAEDNEAPGGYIHSGRFLLVDKLGRIRGVYDGTNADDVDQLIADIPILLNEYH